jgi:hypothetical protein
MSLPPVSASNVEYRFPNFLPGGEKIDRERTKQIIYASRSRSWQGIGDPTHSYEYVQTLALARAKMPDQRT